MNQERKKGARVVRTTSAIVVGSVALSICVIMIALSIVRGFRTEIRDRATGFVGQIIISPFGTTYLNDAYPLSLDTSYLPKIAECDNVQHIQYFAFRHGVIKTGEAMQQVVVKGVGKEFDPTFFTSVLSKGTFPRLNDSIPSMELLVSKRLSESLKIDVDQVIDIWFIDQSTPRIRRFTVSGVYDAVLEEIDQILVIGDLRVVQRLNSWTSKEVGGFELLLHNPLLMERTARDIREIAAQYMTDQDQGLSIITVKDLFSHLFDWLNLIDMNLLIVLILMMAVAGVNMISGLLIMLFDKTSMIGLLKALGMRNRDIRLTFIYRMGRLVLWGMAMGNVVSLTLCLLQKKFAIITLDQTNYAVSSVPIALDVWSILLMNVVSLLLILSIIVAASMMVTRMAPERSLRVK
jgi:lipoprotein-releasing system permease protein